jgi:hypothetical protein
MHSATWDTPPRLPGWRLAELADIFANASFGRRKQHANESQKTWGFFLIDAPDDDPYFGSADRHTPQPIRRPTSAYKSASPRNF